MRFLIPLILLIAGGCATPCGTAPRDFVLVLPSDQDAISNYAAAHIKRHNEAVQELCGPPKGIVKRD